MSNLKTQLCKVEDDLRLEVGKYNESVAECEQLKASINKLRFVPKISYARLIPCDVELDIKCSSLCNLLIALF